MNMEIEKIVSRLSILIIGCDQFDDETIDPLNGVQKDIDQIKELLCENKQAIFHDITPKVLKNPTTEEIRQFLANYVYSRSAEEDILLLYYSGHGVIVNGNQFAFICKNSIRYTINEKIIPSTVITSNEILRTLETAKITPIMIIDACHSGLINPNSSIFNTPTVMESLRDTFHSIFASNFMLFCACAEDEVTPETSLGGYFSRYIVQISQTGDKEYKRKPILTISDIYKIITKQKQKEPLLKVEPRLFFGHGVSDFPLIRNKAFDPIYIQLNNYQIEILELLWNRGFPNTKYIADLDKELGKGAYANYSKLTYEPWQLIHKKSKKVWLTERGISFMNNELKIPEKIYKDDTTNGKYIPDPNTKEKSYYEFRAQMELFDLGS